MDDTGGGEPPTESNDDQGIATKVVSIETHQVSKQEKTILLSFILKLDAREVHTLLGGAICPSWTYALSSKASERVVSFPQLAMVT